MNNKDLKTMFSHNTDHWATPKWLYKKYMDAGYLDPCPLHSNENNLEKIYEPGTKLYINPPYSDIKSWTKFIYNNRRCFIELLIPARTDTKYFHELLKYHPTIKFIKGRLSFNETGTAPFPTIILRFTPYQTINDYETINQTK